VRALRPLRALKRVPGMPVLVQSILAALPRVGNVLALCGFIFLVFAIVGVEAFKGMLHYRCASAGFVESLDHPGVKEEMLLLRRGLEAPPLGGPPRLLKGGSGGGGGGGGMQAEWDSGQACNPELPDQPQCAVGYTCSYFDENPSHDLMSFDNVGVAFISLMQSLTFDDWTVAMYALMDAFSPWVVVYFVAIVVLGGFFVVNLFLAVIFEETLSAQMNEEIAARSEANAAFVLAETEHVLQASPRAAKAAGVPLESIAPPMAARGEGGRRGGAETETLLAHGHVPSDLESGGGGALGALGALDGSPARGCCDCEPREGSCRHLLKTVVQHGAFAALSTSLVLVNMAIMCMPYYGMPPEREAALDAASGWITWIFIWEMVLKIYGLGCAGYWGDGWNLLDGCIVLMSIVEMVMTALFSGGGVKLSFLRILRMLRVARVLRLMKSWKGLYKIVSTFLKVVPQMTNLFILMVLFMLIFSLLGMQIFGGKFNEAAGFSPLPCLGGVCPDPSLQELPRFHFDYFVPAIMTVFVLMTGEWVDAMDPGVGAVGGAASLYYLGVVVVGRYLIINLLIAIVLNAFADDTEEIGLAWTGSSTKPPGTRPIKNARLAAALASGQMRFEPSEIEEFNVQGLSESSVIEANGVWYKPVDALDEMIAESAAEGEAVTVRSVRRAKSTRRGGGGKSEAGTTARTDRAMTTQRQYAEELVAQVDDPNRELEWPRDYSLLIFSVRNPLRRCCLSLVNASWFDMLVIVAIVVSSICLALDSPRLNPHSLLALLLALLDVYVWPWFFLGELVLKSVAFGFAFGRTAYLRSGWNKLDALIVLSSFIVLATATFPFLAPLKNLRVLRVLRPLRLVSRDPGMRLVLESLFKAVPAVGNVVAVILSIQLVFAVLGMQLFMGELASCTDPTIGTKEACLAAARPAQLDPSAVVHHGAHSLAHGAAEGARALAEASAWSTDAALADTVGAAVGTAVSSAVSSAVRAASGLTLPAPAAAAATAALAAAGQLAVGAASNATTAAAEAARSSVRRALKGGSGGGWDGTGAVEWTNPAVGSFDDFASAMLLLYVMSTGDEWEVHMYRMMDSTPDDVSLVRNDYNPAAVYSIVWMFIGSLFAMNLFVAIIVENFNKIKSESDGSATMTQEQLQWVSTMKAVTHQRPARIARPPEGCRLWLYNLVTSQAFDAFIMGVIVANVAVMACDYWGIDKDPSNFAMYHKAMSVFAYIFYTEAVLKLSGIGPAGYFGDTWSRFDFVLVCTSLFDQFASELLAQVLPMPPMLLRVLRILRIVRILRLLKGAKEVRNLIMTMIYSFPSLINVSSILALIVFMYAVLGVDLFTYLKPQEHITNDRNFVDLGHAALLLFQCLTNDAWSGLMADAMVHESSGHCSEAEGNCGTPLAVAYFISFQVIGTFVFLNLVVAVILENFTSVGAGNPDLVSTQDLERFKESWALFDPDADFFMPAADLPRLMLMLPPPLGLEGTPAGQSAQAERRAVKQCMQLELKQYNGDVAYLEVLNALIELNFRQNSEFDVGSDSFRRKAEPLVGGRRVIEQQIKTPPQEMLKLRLEKRPPPPPEELSAREVRAREHPDVRARFAMYTIREATREYTERKHSPSPPRAQNRAPRTPSLQPPAGAPAMAGAPAALTVSSSQGSRGRGAKAGEKGGLLQRSAKDAAGAVVKAACRLTPRSCGGGRASPSPAKAKASASAEPGKAAAGKAAAGKAVAGKAAAGKPAAGKPAAAKPASPAKPAAAKPASPAKATDGTAAGVSAGCGGPAAPSKAPARDPNGADAKGAPGCAGGVNAQAQAGLKAGEAAAATAAATAAAPVVVVVAPEPKTPSPVKAASPGKTPSPVKTPSPARSPGKDDKADEWRATARATARNSQRFPAMSRRNYINPLETAKGVKNVRERMKNRGF
jgi:hypothetical protein